MRLVLITLLLLVGACRGPSEPVRSLPAANTQPERPDTKPEPEPNSDSGSDANSDADPDAEVDPREIVRRRCKPGYLTCAGGRDCCDERTEVCGEDFRCRPR
jgi:hypothetical protein